MTLNINDHISASLTTQGYTGQLSDQLLAWAKANGATANDLNSAILQMLQAQGATSNQINDAWRQALIAIGATGASLADLKHYFFDTLGGVWVAIDSLLLETGGSDNLLLETGGSDALLLE